MIKILGYDYTVISNEDIANMGAWGRCHQPSLTIHIANDLVQQQLESTLLHEIIEAINTALELGLQENCIMSLEASLYQVFRDNGVSLEPLLIAAGIKNRKDIDR